jgi:glucose/arabinose dehydrogenase
MKAWRMIPFSRSGWLSLLLWPGAVLLPLGAQTKSPTPLPSSPAPKPAKPPVVVVPTRYEMEDAFPGLKFEQPLGIVTAAGDAKRLFVVEKTGRVQVITGLDTGTPEKSVFLDLTRLAQPQDKLEASGECGLLGLAFPPDHAGSRRCFAYYSVKINGALHERVSRFQISTDNPNHADSATEQPLFSQADAASNHNGGDLQFGPDGYLYVGVGDGGMQGDALNNGRFINKGFHAAILRIDVDQRPGSLPPNAHPGIARGPDGAAFYAVPPDNPFVGCTSHHGQAVDPQTERTEIWACGLRNPWRISFDAPTGRLFAGDVGQNLYEEVDIIVKGGDYGWSYREGLHSYTLGPGGAKEPEDFHPIAPIFEYPRSVGVSVTGGLVCRGGRLAELRGKYVCADYGTGRVLALQEEEGKAQWTDETLAQEAGIAGIGVDPRDGEVLFANLALGKLKRLKLKATAPPPP